MLNTLNTVINFLFKNFIALWRHLLAPSKNTATGTVIYSHCTNRFEHHTVVVFSHIAEVHQFPRNSVMEFSEYLQ